MTKSTKMTQTPNLAPIQDVPLGTTGRDRWFVAVAVLMTAIGSSLCASTAPAQDQLREGADVQLNNTTPPEQVGVTVDQKLGEEVPMQLPMTDSKGQKVRTGYFIDRKKPTIITLNYSNCPMLCSLQLKALTASLNELDLQVGSDFNVLTVSIDPTESTQRIRETKESYLELLPNQPGAEQGWTFCTAKEPVIRKLADSLGFRYRYDAVNKQYNHPAMLAYVSPDGVISRYSLDIDFPADQMKLALVDAGNGTIGSKVDQFILWCYSYDPNSNSYTPYAWRIMRVGGAATVGLMFACLAPYWIGRKRHPKTTDDNAADDNATDDTASADQDDNSPQLDTL